MRLRAGRYSGLAVGMGSGFHAPGCRCLVGLSPPLPDHARVPHRRQPAWAAAVSVVAAGARPAMPILIPLIAAREDRLAMPIREAATEGLRSTSFRDLQLAAATFQLALDSLSDEV